MSTDRPTYLDVVRAAVGYRHALDLLGIPLPPTAQLVVEKGSKTYGIAWRLALIDDPSVSMGQGNPPVGSSFLGFTAREAYDNLTTRRRVMLDIVDCLKEKAER